MTSLNLKIKLRTGKVIIEQKKEMSSNNDVALVMRELKILNDKIELLDGV